MSYEVFTVPVPGGDLTVGRWGDGPEVVVAAHGITANHRSWALVADALAERAPDTTLIAPDLRGRGGSAALPGPYGMPAHAGDMIAVLDHLGVDRAVWLGHSMGGFVVAVGADRHPERVRALVAVDGGLGVPVDLPPDTDVEQIVRTVIGAALDRLEMSWTTVDDYVDFVRSYPAFSPPNELHPDAESYVRYDAVIGDDGRVRSRVAKDAVLADGGAAFTDPDSVLALRRVTVPATLLWAPRGMFDQSPGLYPPTIIDATMTEIPDLCCVEVPDTNHYTIVLSRHGAAAVADDIAAAVHGESH